MSLVLGADAAYVASSVYLPASSGYTLSDARLRARAGISYQAENTSVFWGLTWLGKEFAAQTSDQVVGSMSVVFKFK